MFVFVDESKRARYVVVAVAVADGDVTRVRRSLRLLIPAGQRRIHFKSDSDKTRHRVLDALKTMPIKALVVEGPVGERERIARRCCLEAVADWVPPGARVVVEIDKGIVDADRRVLDPLARSYGYTYSHMTPNSDPGLWLPDAVAWSWTRGGIWRDALGALAVELIRIDK